jgi:hypothetical protein
MKRSFLKLFTAVLFVASVATVHAQIQTPSASPTAELKQRVGLTDVTIVYSRPSMKDRVVFADNGIVPFGQIWRTGANSATKLSFSDPVQLGGKELNKGDYAILTVPNAMEWKVMVYAYDGTNWSAYTSKTPVAEFMAKPEKLSNKVETFTMDLNNVRNDGATIDVMWENTKVSLPLSVEVDSRVMASIDRVMAGPSAGDYSAAATYYFENKKDLNKALEWIQKANAMGTPAYWTLHREALILGELGRKKEAIAVAERSMSEAMKAKDDTYVRLNKEAIAKWSK